MRASYAVKNDGALVYDVIVTVNDLPTQLLMNGQHATADFTADPGDPVDLVVQKGDFLASAFLTMPDQLTVTAPTGTQDASQDITVEWNAPSYVPDLVQVIVFSPHTVSGDGWLAIVDGANTSVTIPAGTLVSASAGVEFYVTSINETTDLGTLAGAGSRVTAAYRAQGPAFTTQ